MEERADVMTDFQAKMMLNMIIDIVREKKDPEKVIERLIEIRDGTADKENKQT